MTWRPACWVLLAAIVVAASPVFAIAPPPVWGARQSSPVDTPPGKLKPGQWIWAGRDTGRGPIAVIASLTEQRAYVYRNGVLIAVTTISSGRPGYETPTGIFTILQKDRDHRSNLYKSAPMPYQQRLTWDGVALHAGGLPGYPESHGCVHMPTEFARRLFAASSLGMTVVVSKASHQPDSLVHPGVISPIDFHTGEPRRVPLLEDGQAYRWQPQASTSGPVSIVLGVADGMVIVFRNGIEIGRSRVIVRDPLQGTHAYIVADGYMQGEVRGLPGRRMPNWLSIGIPGRGGEAGQLVKASLADRVVLPPGFLEHVLALLTPGTVLVATDRSVDTHGSGAVRQVIDAVPAAAVSTAPGQ